VWGAWSDVWRLQTGTGTASESPQEIPDLQLQVYPNPVFGSATIVVRKPTPTYASLTIWDARGRRVARIVDGVLTGGTHRYLWDAELTSPGLYIVRLETEGKSLTESVVVMR
jgi:hypothetical protein